MSGVFGPNRLARDLLLCLAAPAVFLVRPAALWAGGTRRYIGKPRAMNDCDVTAVTGHRLGFKRPAHRPTGVWTAIACAFYLMALMLPARSVLAVEVSQTELENRRCLNCHGQSHIGELKSGELRAMVAPSPAQDAKAPRPGLFVPSGALASGVHKELSCVSCHAEAQTLPHAQKLAPANCTATCHSSQKSDFLQSTHAQILASGDNRAPTCSTCHGSHDIRPKADKTSKTYPLNSIQLCGSCHKEQEARHAPTTGPTTSVAAYLDSVHGKAVAGGLVVAATCADCHSPHKVLPSVNPRSTVNRQNVATTCGACHAGVAEKFRSSIHGTKLADGNPRAPSCTGCHTAHEISRTSSPAFLQDIVNECGTCHDRIQGTTGRKSSLYDTYRRSYHGQVSRLGSVRAARCSSCHGSHDILPASDPASRLHGDNRVATCRSCHPQAGAGFATFQPHADHHDAAKYPILHIVWLYFVVMMSFSFGFFGLHCIFWFIRSVIERIKHGPHPHHPMHGKSIQRFNRVDRVNHAFVIISFFGLALTGLPLLYSDKVWAQWIMDAFGGVRSAGLAHRAFAVMLILNFLVHGVGLIRRIRKHTFKKLIFGPTSMMMGLKDLKDLIGMYRWFLLGGKKPPFDRWTYWEKFDYMAEVGGSGIIGVTGLLLWFPEFFSRYLPGWIFNVATIIHGYEALLAIGFIFTIHFFNAHLRLEKFPVDDVMFTGRLPEEEFKEERGVEYERLKAQGELDALRVDPPPKVYRIVAVTCGILAMIIGTTIAVLIILAGLNIL